MSDERGQALILAVVVLAMAAVAIGGLRLAQERILEAHLASRAGEAAVEAAAAVVADAVAAGADPTSATVAATARDAANDLSRRNGGAAIDDLTVSCGTRWIEVAVTARRATYRAAIEATCFPR